MDSFCFSKCGNTASIIMKLIPPLNTVLTAKIHERAKKSKISCQQRNTFDTFAEPWNIYVADLSE